MRQTDRQKDTETQREIGRQRREVDRQIHRYMARICQGCIGQTLNAAYPVHSTRFSAQFVEQKKEKKSSGSHVATTLLWEDIGRKYVESQGFSFCGFIIDEPQKARDFHSVAV